MQRFITLGGIFGFLAVAIGAFGAHAVKAQISAEMLEVYRTGTQYQMYHALAILAVGILLHFFPGSKALNAAGWLFSAGIILFSGSLYVLALSDIKILGAITPLGGLCFLGGWICMIVGVSAAVKTRKQ